jgi:hypothetical protein
MSLTTEEIIGGMYRAHQAGQPFAALVANPHFANLSLEDKKQVLAGFRKRMGGESSSAVNAIANVVKGTAGGAAAGIPLGMAVPLALEMSETGATRRSVLDALKTAASNKNVKLLVGTGMAVGAVGGLINSAMQLYQAKKDRSQMRQDLEEASQGGEALAAASFGAIGGHGVARQVNVDPVVKTFRDIATPYAVTSARYGHYASLVDAKSPDHYAEVITRAHEKALQGQPQSPQGLANIAKELAKTRGHYDSLKGIVVNSPRELNIDPATIGATVEEIDRLGSTNETNIQNLNTLEQFARQVRDMKRGVQ